MGTIAQVFESGEQSAKKGLFGNLVRLARVDGNVSEAEIVLLDKIARRLSLTIEQANEIIKHPDNYPMVPPVSLEERFERYIQLIQMAFADGMVDEQEKKLIAKYGIALGFRGEDAINHAKTILDQVVKGVESADILKSLA
jgi:uncharacterized tellurite resistance protein B-like protein